MYQTSDRAHVAWDIETTGFGWSAELTVSGFWFPASHATLILNAGPHVVNETDIEERLTEACHASVSLVLADDETALLETMRRVVFERFDHDYNRLVAFNAESWKGGFDLPFVRTRCIRQGVDWMFDGVTFADLWEPIKKRFNTTYTAYNKSTSVNSLTGSYALLFGQNDRSEHLLEAFAEHTLYRESPYDPFDTSGSAAARYRDGDLLPVCLHNLADVHRTWELGELVREFVSPKDITEKKL